MNSLTKNTRLYLGCDQEVRRLLDKAAAYAHLSISEFVLRNAVEQTQNLARQHGVITLSQQNFTSFLDALEIPDQPATPTKCDEWCTASARWTLSPPVRVDAA